MARFDGKVVVITGAAGAIGRAAAIRFGQDGAQIVAVDRETAGLDGVVADLRAAGIAALGVPADVTQAAQVAGYVAAAQAHFGGLDILFNNAAILGWLGPSTDYPEEVFDRVFAVNVKGIWLGMKYAVPALRERGAGVIINTASVAGLGAAARYLAYGASKHAVIGLTQTMAVEYARDHIRVNAVCPSAIESPMARAWESGLNPDDPAAVQAAVNARVPLGRYAEPAEVAALVAFLASDEAAYITGGIYTVDGGIRAH